MALLYRLVADIPELNARAGSLLVLSSGSVQVVTTLAIDMVAPHLDDADRVVPVAAEDVCAPVAAPNRGGFRKLQLVRPTGPDAPGRPQ